MNLVVLKGNLTRDPEVRVVKVKDKDVSVANFSVAVSRHFRKANGDKDQDTTFITCEAWDTAAETIGKYLVKGSAILVEGSLKNETWEVEGQKRSRVKVRVLRFEMCGGKRNEDSQPDTQDTEQPDSDDDDSPTPF